MSGYLATPDLVVIAFFIVVFFTIGLVLSRRASRSTEEFFISGRSLPWWIVGTSMVATTFAADTPLVVSGLVARGGIFKNWLWWQWGIGGIVAVFLFARLWRRARITTDAELAELRYDGRPAAVLRGYRAVWFGFFQNILVIAWVMKAMAKVIVVVMGWEGEAVVLGMDAEVLTVLVLFVVAVLYTALSGLWGVVMTDFLQFVIAMGGSIYLAVAALRRLGGIAGLREGLAEHGFDLAETLRIVPDAAPLFEANVFTEFLVLILIVWWAHYNIDGGGYLAQRLFAARDERHSALGYLWYSIAHICLRPWPWIVVGLCGMALLGTVDDPETYFPLMMREVLPPGFFGLLVASFFAAFMSTVDTQLNWGSSLLVNDFARRFLWPGRSERFYLVAARLTVVALAVAGALLSFAVSDISFAWKLVISITAGLGTVVIARWYWWRVNAWSEVSAMATALVCTIVFGMLSKHPEYGDMAFLRFPYSVAVTVLVSFPVWLLVTFLTPPVGHGHLERFYRRVRPGGPGWRAFAPPGAAGGGWMRTVACIVSGVVLINGALIGIGKLVLRMTAEGLLALAVAAAAGAALITAMRAGDGDGERRRSA